MQYTLKRHLLKCVSWRIFTSGTPLDQGAARPWCPEASSAAACGGWPHSWLWAARLKAVTCILWVLFIAGAGGITEESGWFSVSLLSFGGNITPEYITKVKFFFINKKNGHSCEEVGEGVDESHRHKVAWEIRHSTHCLIPVFWWAGWGKTNLCWERSEWRPPFGEGFLPRPGHGDASGGARHALHLGLSCDYTKYTSAEIHCTAHVCFIASELCLGTFLKIKQKDTFILNDRILRLFRNTVL